MNDLNGLDQTVLERIDEIVENAVRQGQAPGVVAAVACGEAVHVATAGVMAVGSLQHCSGSLQPSGRRNLTRHRTLTGGWHDLVSCR